jgi:glycosyltransferase involved in cell wall biosynthesis
MPFKYVGPLLMSKPKILYLVHNHPSLIPGGAEQYALELYESMRSSSEFEPLLVARAGPPATELPPHEGTSLRLVNGDSNQYLLITSLHDYNGFLGRSSHQQRYTDELKRLLVTYQPALVHVQHTLLLGFDILRQIKNCLPSAPIVYTLHEFQAICHHDGQMVRTHDMELCNEESPQRCHQCFPQITPAAFFRRKRFILSQLQLVDLFLAPSKYLLNQYVQWGIAPARIRFEEYGRLPSSNGQGSEGRKDKNRFAFFGQCTRYKGLEVLLQAMQLIDAESHTEGDRGLSHQSMTTGGNADVDLSRARKRIQARLWVHGANLELQATEFQSRIQSLRENAGANVTWVGPYEHSQLPRLMSNVDWVVVPSTWWENSPLVIQEAFQHRKPVICSNIGGMAEKVSHGVNGLHFRVGEPESLAETISLAARSPELWQKLRSGIPTFYRMDEHAATLTQIYRDLLAGAISSR